MGESPCFTFQRDPFFYIPLDIRMPDHRNLLDVAGMSLGKIWVNFPAFIASIGTVWTGERLLVKGNLK